MCIRNSNNYMWMFHLTLLFILIQLSTGHPHSHQLRHVNKKTSLVVCLMYINIALWCMNGWVNILWNFNMHLCINSQKINWICMLESRSRTRLQKSDPMYIMCIYAKFLPLNITCCTCYRNQIYLCSYHCIYGMNHIFSTDYSSIIDGQETLSSPTLSCMFYT